MMQDLGARIASALFTNFQTSHVENGLKQEVERLALDKYLHFDWKQK
ncbi:MAG: hypothetical protein R3C11_26120 [Planctomycetaceae bacterium]